MSFRTITSTTPGPCACCGVGGATLYCRTRGGIASLLGCGEIVTPSTPAKAYLRAENAGGSSVNGWINPGCSGAPDTSTVCTYSRFRQYNRTTGILTTGGSTTCNGVPDTTPIECIPGSGFVDNCLGNWTLTPTQASRIPTVTCCQFGVGDYRKVVSDTLTYTLSDEDTDADAIARLLAGAGGTWSAYTVVGDGTLGTCLATSCCKAQWQQRTTGFSIAYQEAQFKAVMTLLDPLTNYIVNFEIYRRLQGSSDDWVLLLVSPYAFTTDASGNYTITDEDVPNLEGYETYVCCPLIYKP